MTFKTIFLTSYLFPICIDTKIAFSKENIFDVKSVVILQNWTQSIFPSIVFPIFANLSNSWEKKVITIDLSVIVSWTASKKEVQKVRINS